MSENNNYINKKYDDGDIIYITRKKAGVKLFDHFGIYSGNNNVIHFVNPENRWNLIRSMKEAKVREDNIDFFKKEGEVYSIKLINSSDKNKEDDSYNPVLIIRIAGIVKHIIMNDIVLNLADKFIFNQSILKYGLNIHDQKSTVLRAKFIMNSEHHEIFRKGKYNPINNNCEHFAMYCKTGILDSKQIGAITNFIRNCI